MLHDYANVYVTARNPMLYKRIAEDGPDQLCVVQVAPSVLDLDGVVVTDKNAAASFCRFRPPAEGINELDPELIRRTFWGDGDALEQTRCWDAKFTEVLVPQKVPIEYLAGIAVGNDAAEATLVAQGCPLPIATNARLFFQ